MNPVEHFKKDLIQVSAVVIKKLLPNKDSKWIDHYAKKRWLEWQKVVLATRIPRSLLNLLTSSAKRDQVSILKNLCINQRQLTAFTFEAWNRYKFRYSFYWSESLPSDIKESDLPMFFSTVKDEEVKIVGKTQLSKGKLKQVIEHRHYIAAKFLDSGNVWHCFFYTFKSLNGEEKSGEKHCHYISNAFGMTRDEVLKRIKSNRYNLNSLPHIRIV